jgi:plastocyanin
MRRGSSLAGLAAMALGALFAAPAGAVQALHSEIVSVRSVEPGKQRYLFRYGPLTAAPGQNLQLLGPVTIERPLGAGYVTRYRPNLVDETGNPPAVEEVHMHHAVFVNMSKPDHAAPNLPQRIGGFAEEKTVASLPEPYGYPVSASDVWAINYMLHNGTRRSRTVYIEMEIDWVPSGTPLAATLTPAYPLWLDVRNSETYPVFDTHRGSGRGGTITYPDDFPDPYRGGPRLNDWVADRDMTLVATAGHLHPGGLWTDLDVVRGGRSARIFRSEARYFDPNGPVSWDMAMEFSPPDWRVAVRKGDTLRISTTYETERASWYESMGLNMVYFAEGASGADPFADPVQTSGEPTHGPLPEARNHGGRPTNRPDARTLADGATLADGVGIANFQYLPGDQQVAGQLGLPPVIDPGRSLQFGNFDAAASIPHTVTACRAPCNRETGVSYPLADGEVDFDSGQLGYGPPNFTAMAQRADWFTPSDLEPGTYTYFCRVHPYMRGAFRVRGTPRPEPPPGRGGDDRSAPATRIATKRATADRGGRLRVRVGCSGGGTCAGKLRLQVASGARTKTIGSARYSVAAGRTATVRIRLTRAGLAALRKRRKMRVSAVAKGSGGTVARSIVLRAPSR